MVTQLKFFFTAKATAQSVRSRLRDHSILSSVISRRGDSVVIVHVPTKNTNEQTEQLVRRLAGSLVPLYFEVFDGTGPLT